MIYDALIIGGGPAGATAAIMLARAGWSVALAEKKIFPRRKVCGEFISASSMALLRELGVAPQFEALAGPPVRRVGLFAGEHVLDAPMPAAANEAVWGRALGREHLDLMLCDQAARAGATLFQPATVRELRQTTDGHSCSVTCKNGAIELAARVVIAAHGSWEPGTLPTQSASVHRPSDLLAFKAHFTGAELPADVMPLLVFPGGYGGMAHTDGGRVSLSCCIRRDVLQQSRTRHHGHAAEAVFAHIRRSCRGVADALASATLDDTWLSAGPIRPGLRKRFAAGVFLVGNAAGEAHPIVAEGISMAMQSAWLLCRRLIAGNGLSPAVQSEAGAAYAADWRAAFATRIHAAAVFAQLAQRPVIAGMAAPLLSRFPEVLTLGARLSGKTRLVVAA